MRPEMTDVGMGPQQYVYMFLYLKRAAPKTNGATELAPFPHLSLVLCPPSCYVPVVYIIMLTTQIPCHGCGRLFSLRGLCQHVSKTQDPRCQNALRTSRVQAAPFSFQNAGVSPPVDPNNAEPISNDGGYGVSASKAEIFDGVFAITHGVFSFTLISHAVTPLVLSCTYIPYYVYLPDRLSALTGLISDLATI